MKTIPTLALALLMTSSLLTVGCDGDDDPMSSEMEMSDETGSPTPTTDATPMDSTGAMPDGESTTGDPPMQTTGPSGMSSSTTADTDIEGSSSTGQPVETAGNSERFEDVITKAGMQALLDLETNLLWVNDVNACNPLGAPNENTPMQAMQYCADLVFQGHEDWRMPTTDEASELITVALAEGVDLVYQNPGCPAVITMGGVAVETHNGDNPGDVTEMPPSLGIRCVRLNG